MTVDSATIANALRSSVGDGIHLRARRPGLYQVSVPASLGDGDDVQVFARLAGDRIVVTDLGHTLMRASYSQPLTAKMTEAVETLARRNGFSLVEGEIKTTVQLGEVFVALLGMVQIQAQAEVALAAPVARAERAEAFKRSVVQAIKTALDDCDVGFFDKTVDPDGLFPIDLVVHGRRWVGVSIVASDTDASNAALAKLKHAQSPLLSRHRPFWAAIPRDMSALTQLSQRRVMSEFFPLTGGWESAEHGQIISKIRDLAEPAAVLS